MRIIGCDLHARQQTIAMLDRSPNPRRREGSRLAHRLEEASRVTAEPKRGVRQDFLGLASLRSGIVQNPHARPQRCETARDPGLELQLY
jgi:hypothetical protein